MRILLVAPQRARVVHEVFDKPLEGQRISSAGSFLPGLYGVLRTEEGMVDVRFWVEGLRIVGDYRGYVRLRPEDIALLFALSFQDEPYTKVQKALSDASIVVAEARAREAEGAEGGSLRC